jgi:hypothetical protein
LEWLEWLEPNRKYFLEAEGPAAILPTRRDRNTIDNKLRGLNAKWQEIKDFLDLFSNWKNLVDRVHGRSTGDREWAHGRGSLERDRPGARARRSTINLALGLTGARRRWPGKKTAMT